MYFNVAMHSIKSDYLASLINCHGMKGLQEKERTCILLIKRKKCEQVSSSLDTLNGHT